MMTKYMNRLLPLLFVAIAACFAACDKDDEISSIELISSLLTTGGTWNVQSVTVSGTDQTSLYSGLQLSFTATNYTTVNGGSIWPASGTWQFTDETATTIKRSDDVLITVVEAEEKKLVLSFTWSKTTLGSGRTGSISGQHVFTFVRP